MLTLQRASAGSGKTYALTKIYISLLISVAVGDGETGEGGGSTRRRLRNRAELGDSMSHILAITFTNKATSEMKQRIVAALSALANYRSGARVDYMDDFCKEFGATPEKVSRTCRSAISILLNDYSNFKVSTIDSFFQSVLRTFAYETHLNDGYGVEIDSEYMAGEAVDSVFQNLESGAKRSDVKEDDVDFWLRLLMERAQNDKKSWNVFFRSSNNKIVSGILETLKKLEMEEYRTVSGELDEYFERVNFVEEYRKLKDYFEKPYEDALAALREKGEALVRLAAANGIEVSDMQNNLQSRLRKILKEGELWNKGVKPVNMLTVAAGKKMPKDLVAELNAAAVEFQQMRNDMYEIPGEWKAYDELLPYLGIIQTARRHINDFLSESNSILLSDTNSILAEIISDSDTPFVYERIGSRLHHMLIDEFQDTSRMQWKNLAPLVRDCVGNGHDSLLIGDAKQSIYRFRNADPTIISHTVPAEFVDIDFRGAARSENTNWRSDLRVIQFNNYLFQFLSRICSPELGALYSNTVQYPAHQKREGYVEIRVVPASSNSDEEDEGEALGTYRPVCELISSLLRRGYRQRDIALLFRRKGSMQKMVDAFMSYNQILKEGDEPIEFLSEDSLSLEFSQGISIVISCLRSLAEGRSRRVEENPEREEKNKKESRDWHEIKTDLAFYLATHEGRPEDLVMEFLEGSGSSDILSEVIGSMQSTALPGLVEALIDKFVDKGRREKEAPYLAAFQDAVLEYCGSYPADVGSFLEWWDMKGKKRSITASEETNAVQLMTIHKSKGLEFGCVILPDADMKLADIGNNFPRKEWCEWTWVKPALETPEGISFPPRVPLVIYKPLVAETRHEGEYLLNHEKRKMDSLNLAYVAFTRAVHELYAFLPLHDRDLRKGFESRVAGEEEENGGGAASIVDEESEITGMGYIGDQLTDLLLRDNIPGGEAEDDIMLPDWSEFSYELPAPPCGKEDAQTEGSGGQLAPYVIFRYGTPMSEEGIAAEKRAREEKNTRNNKVADRIEGYYVNPDITFLKYKEADTPHPAGFSPIDGSQPEEEDEDPRSEGNLQHKAMQWILREGDVERAVMKLKRDGWITYRQMDYYRERLQGAVGFARSYGWFTEDWRVLPERPVLERGHKALRPDRVMVSADGREVIIVDYKFGEKALKTDSEGHQQQIQSRHRRQVSEYMDKLRKTGLYDRVRGYVWYVPFSVITEVE